MTTITKNQENAGNESRLFSAEERAIFSEVAAKEPPYSNRAQALLAIDEGATQSEAGRQAGLTMGQVRYWLRKFRKEGTSIFPQELLIQAEPEEVSEEEAGEEEAQQEMPDVEETTAPAAGAAPQEEDASKAKKKPKKKSKKKSKKKTMKKSKKQKKAKQGKKKKGKKSAKKSKKKSKK